MHDRVIIFGLIVAFIGSGISGSNAAPCDVTGYWTGFFPQPLHDEYFIQWNANGVPGAFVSTCVTPNCGWMQGRGQLSADNSTALMIFDGGMVVLQGTVSSDCSTVNWNNTSVWKRTVPVTVVHVIMMNHLDVGYNGIPQIGFINNVLNRYFDVYFPQAVALAQTMRDMGLEERLVYTTHPWLVQLYIDCPVGFTMANITLHCPSQQDLQAFHAAVKQGDIVWHAGPFNMEFENMMTPFMVKASLQVAKDISDFYGLPHPITVSQRDVPGTTRSVIPVLVESGIKAFSVGVNNAVPPPAVSNPSVWLDKESNTSILFMQHNGGYPNNPGDSLQSPGGLSRPDCVIVPMFNHALCFAFRTDNSGPPSSVEEVVGYFGLLREEFPGAQVYASTFDNFTNALATAANLLPVFTQEVGDTWLNGVPSDPWKMVWYREAARAYEACVTSGSCDPTDQRLQRFAHKLVKLPEHTWGLPSLNDDSAWTNTAFHAARASGSAAFANVEAAWQEQRTILTEYGLAELGSHPLAADIQSRWKALQPQVPNTSGYSSVAPAQWGLRFSCGNATLAFDPVTGSLASYTVGSGSSWADPQHLLASFVYQTYNDTDFASTNDEYQYEYACCFGKGSSQKVANPQRLLLRSTLQALWTKGGAGGMCSFLAQMTTDATAVSYYGAPQTLWLNVTVDPASGNANVDLQLFNKTSTRLGEALWFAFEPTPSSGFAWTMNKLGSWVDPLDMVVNGSNHQHGINAGARFGNDDTYLMVGSLDVPLVSPTTANDRPTALPNPMGLLQGPVLGMYFNLFANTWDTNYAFYTLESDFHFRFSLQAQ